MGSTCCPEVGQAGSERAPLCQPRGRQAGQTLRPDAVEKETTAQAGPGPLPSYSSKRAGGQGVIKGGLSLPRPSGQDENAPRCGTRPTGNLRFRAGEGGLLSDGADSRPGWEEPDLQGGSWRLAVQY